MDTKQAQTSLIGDYEILKELGSGMLGRVFLAQHRYLKKRVVIKVLPEELSQNKAFIQRFEKEVAHLGILDHPHIVKMQTVSIEDNTVFLVCDSLADSKGEMRTLTSLLEEKKSLGEEEIYKIAKQIAAALDYAHEQNISDEPLAHRGLKFNNILIDPSKEELTIQIADFGLSRIVGIGAVLSRTYRILWEMMAFQAGFSDTQLDQFGSEEGDLRELHKGFSQYYAFLAPEQKGRAGTSRDVDAKADIYSFGILLYFLLVGKFPEGFFPMPSECNLDLKKNWDPIIKQCLNIDPEKRPSKLVELLEQITSYSESEEVKPILKPQEIKRPEYEEDPSAVFQTDKTVAIYTPKEQEIKDIEPLLTEMVILDAGTFLRGSNHGARDEMPRHAIHLPSFAIDVHPITNEQFIRFLMVMGGEKDVNNNDIIRLRDSRIRRRGGKLIIESGYAKHPVVGVTWYGALAYAKWIGKRLPTEAEWEIAAYGGLEGAQYPTGEDIERSQANFFNADTTPVKSYPPNEIGLYDIAGNVYEWCMDWYGYHYYETSLQEPENPGGPDQGVYRVLRGGCWKSLKEDMRCSHRHRNNPGIMNGTYGFRCAADVN